MIENKSIQTLRMLGVEAINKANSGHPGIVLGAAPMAYTLFNKHMISNPDMSSWINRDRFVLSAGHGSALLYSLLHLSGFGITIEDLKNFRQIGSITPGHPETYLAPGVDATTGPLGQGLAMAVGMALAETYLGAHYNKPNFDLIDHYTYVICGDGDLQEGVAHEAISLAGHWKLNKLIVLWDSNDVQLDTMTDAAQSENIAETFTAAQWKYLKVTDGNDVNAINAAIEQAKTSSQPTLIEVKTVIGFGAEKAGTPAVHGAPLGAGIEAVKESLNCKDRNPFSVEEEVYQDFKTNFKARGKDAYKKWQDMYHNYGKEYPSEFEKFKKAVAGNFTIDPSEFMNLKSDNPEATRISSGKILDRIVDNKHIIGGSADLSCSTKIMGKNGIFSNNHYQGGNIAYGVREFAMGAINNGIALHKGLLSFSGGFLIFSDYVKPAIRLSALMELPVLYLFTHDSIAVGEDGPTHQPVEQLAMLRSTPNLNVFRPADFKESLGAYTQALKSKKTPSVILFTRQDLGQLEKTNVDSVALGAYSVYGTESSSLIITATGSEVELAIKVAKKLETYNYSVRVISMVCRELFEKQSDKYRAELYPYGKKLITLEMGATYGWGKYGDINIGIDTFGSSAPAKDVFKEHGFTVDAIVDKIVKNI